MSYALELRNTDGSTVQFKNKHHFKGDIYAIGGTRNAEFNITYNYSKILRRVLKRDEKLYPIDTSHAYMEDEGIRAIYGLTSAQAIPMLEMALLNLNINIAVEKTSGDYISTTNYWTATNENVEKALMVVLEMSRIGRMYHKDAIWWGD